jgi:DNA-binding transcriptional regulator LsrR (DeoR family)
MTLNQQGMTQVQAAGQMGISRRSVQRAKAKLENYGDVEGVDKNEFLVRRWKMYIYTLL